MKSAVKNPPTTPYKNIKLSTKKFDGVKTSKAVLNYETNDFEDRCKIFNRSGLSNNKLKGSSNIKNSADVQKVRDAILGSIDGSNSEYGALERRKMRFLNSLDESKDLDFYSHHKKIGKNASGNNDLLEKCKDVQKILNKQGLIREKIGIKNEPVKKVEVFLSSQENNDFNKRK